MSLLPILVLLFVVMWFVVVRPQRRRQSEQQRMLESIVPGADVLTVGGMYGTLTAVDEDEVRVELAEGVEIRMARRAIAEVLTPPESGQSELEELERLQEQAAEEAQATQTGEASRL